MFVAVGNRSQILSKPTAQFAQMSICGASLNKGEKFTANAVHVNAAEGRAYLRLLDGRGWVSERLRTNFAKFVVKPCDGSWDSLDLADDDAPKPKMQLLQQRLDLLGSGASKDDGSAARSRKVIAVERPKAADSDATAAAVKAETHRERSPPRAASVFRTDEALWPQSLRPVRPLDNAMRCELRRLYKLHGSTVKECQRDVADAEEKANSFGRKCDNEKALRAYAESLRKESAKAERSWTDAVEAALAKGTRYESDVAPDNEVRVLPAQVAGRRWFCAVVPTGVAVATEAGGEAMSPETKAGATTIRHFGPLRRSLDEASADYQQLKRRRLDEGGAIAAAGA
jgi:hypothetical protein